MIPVSFSILIYNDDAGIGAVPLYIENAYFHWLFTLIYIIFY